MRRLKKFLALMIALAMFIQLTANVPLSAANNTHPEESTDILDLTGTVYTDNLASPEDIERIYELENQDAHFEEPDGLYQRQEGEEARLLSQASLLASWDFTGNTATAINNAVNAAIAAGGVNTQIPANHSSVTPAPILQFLFGGTPRVLNGVSSGINVLNAEGTGNGGLNSPLHEEGNHAWWQTRISTEEKVNIEVEWAMRSTNTAPRDFSFQYSLDGGTTWVKVRDIVVQPGGLALSDERSRFHGALPAAAEGQEEVMLRWVITSNTATNGSPIAAGGTHQINHLFIRYQEGTGTGGTTPISTARTLVNTGQRVTVEGYITGSQAAAVAFMQAPNASGPNDGILVSVANASNFTGQRVKVTGYIRQIQGHLRINEVNTNTATSVVPEVVNATIAQIAPLPITIEQAQTGFEGILVSLITPPVQIANRHAATGAQSHTLVGTDVVLRANLGIPAGAFDDIQDGSLVEIHRGHVFTFTQGATDERRVYSSTFPNDATLISMTGIGNAQRIALRQETPPPPPILTIAQAHEASGTVTVEGYATITVGLAGNDAGNLMIQDGSGSRDGIIIWAGAGNSLVEYVGHRVRVTGNRGANLTVNQIAINVSGGNIQIIERDVTTTPAPVNSIDDMVPPHFRTMMVTLDRVQFRHRDDGPPPGTGTGVPPVGTHYLIGSGGQRFEIRLATGEEFPAGLQTGDWIKIERAFVHWFNGRSAVQLIHAVVSEAAPPLVSNITADPISGSILPLDSMVALTTSPEAARIRYSVNGGAFATSTAATVNVPVTAFLNGEFVIEAYAIYPDVENPGGYIERTELQRFVYTQITAANVVPSHVSGRIRPGTELLLKTATENATIHYILTTNVGNVGGTETVHPEAVYTDGILITSAMLPVRITAVARASGYGESAVLELDFTERTIGGEGVFFGQLHAHTIMSDGIGTPEAAFIEARDVAGLDFFALSDHSNWFDFGYTAPGSGVRASGADGPSVFNLEGYNATGSYRWTRGVNAAAAAYVPGEFLPTNAFEFTWAGGPGHINTFNTTGWVCRNNAYLNVSNNDLRLQRYYELLRRSPESISMFNHPGTTFGNFNNFAHFDPEVALRIPLIEVSNGEGAIGSGGFFPSHEQYIMALDRGWLLGPANSQDNHRGRFGWANEGRVAIYTNDFSMDGMWQAFRDRAVFSTEIRDMEIRYYVNNEPMGTVLHTVPPVAEFVADIYIPETPRVNIPGAPRDTYVIRSIALVTNGGVELERQAFNTPVGEVAEYRVTMDNPEPGYYFLRVVATNSRGQERISMTAPVWIGRAPLVGIAEVTTDTFMPITDEELTLDIHLFNDHHTDITLRSVEVLVDGVSYDFVPHNFVIHAGETAVVPFEYTPLTAGIHNITVRGIINVDGVYRVYYGFITLHVRLGDYLDFIGIDASHFNEYVDGNFRNSYSNFAQVAADLNFRTVILRNDEDILNATENPRFRLLIFSSPGRHASIINDPERGEHRTYSQAVVDAVAKFALEGGTVLVTGHGNFNDSGGTIPGIEGAASYAQNRLLRAMGSNIRIGDTSHSAPVGFRETANAHQHDLRFRENFNLANPFMEGVVPYEDDEGGNGQLYRNFSTGALFAVYDGSAPFGPGLDNTARGVLPAEVNPMVFAHPGSWALDSNTNQGAGRIKYPLPVNFPRYEHPLFGLAPAPPQGTGHGQRQNADRQDGQILVGASQKVGEGNVVVFASIFFTNFDIRRDLDNVAELPNANLTISENILRAIATPPVITPIEEVWEADRGEWFFIEGIATSPGMQNIVNPSENRGFINSMYIQDETGGINLFEVARDIEIGQKVRAFGYVSYYQGERQLTVHRGGRIEVIDREIHPALATEMTIEDTLGHTGLLVQVEGLVSNVTFQPGSDTEIVQFTLTDDSHPGGKPVFMRSYITPGVDLSFVEEGARVRVTGLASVGELVVDYGPRIRVRDRGEIVLLERPVPRVNLGFDIFNNGPGGSPSRPNAAFEAAGTIRMWTQLDGVNRPVPYGELRITAQLPDGSCAMRFVTINRPWADQTTVNFIDVNKNGPWQRINLTATLQGSVVEVVLINSRFFALDLFNNGTGAGATPSRPNPGLAASGTIRIWTQLGGVNRPVPFAGLAVTAQLPDGRCAMEFVTINRPWVDQTTVNFIDVNKNRPWERIYLTATVFGQRVEVVLVNDFYVPTVLSLDIFNNGPNGTPGRPNANLGPIIRMWTQINGVNTPVLFDDLRVTATLPNGDCAMAFVVINRPWVAQHTVNFIDVRRDRPWEIITLTIEVDGRTATVILCNR